MIFGNENVSTYSRANVALWMVLAFQAGVINVGGFLGCRAFVSHLTGHVALSAVEFRSDRVAHGLGLVLVALAFLVGSMISGVLVDLRQRSGRRPKYFLVFGFVFLLTLATAIGGFNDLFGEFGAELADERGYFLAFLLSFTCGVQNGTITLVSKSVVRTTHLTGLVTDLGIGLVRVWNRKRLSGIEGESLANVMRIGIIGAFFAGSFVAVQIFRDLKFRGFIVPCVISAGLFAISFYFQVVRRR